MQEVINWGSSVLGVRRNYTSQLVIAVFSLTGHFPASLFSETLTPVDLCTTTSLLQVANGFGMPLVWRYCHIRPTSCWGNPHFSWQKQYPTENAGSHRVITLRPSGILQVLILTHDRERNRVSLSTKKLEAKPGDMLRDPASVYAHADEMAAAYKYCPTLPPLLTQCYF